MKTAITKISAIIIAAAFLSPLPALALDPFAAKIKVSSGILYDYIVIGENARATDGYDNAYDTLQPGENLNADYISSYFAHPEWGAVKNNFRGDIRSIAEKQEWTVTIASTLPAGTDLSIAVMPGKTSLPGTLLLTAKDIGNTASANIVNSALHIPAPGPGSTAMITITALQQAGVTPPPEPKPKSDQTISAITATPSALVNGGSATLSATATSGLPVIFNSKTTSICTVSGVSVTAVTAGTCGIVANQGGNETWNPAPQVTSSITVTPPPPPPLSKPTGDFNGDGKVNKDDVEQLQKYIAKKPANIPSAYLERADMNRDGKLTKEDVKIIEELIKRH